MGLLTVSAAIAAAAGTPAAKAPPLPVLATISVVKLATDSALVVAPVVTDTPHLDPALTRAKLRQPLIAFQAPARFIALARPAAFTVAPAGKANEVARAAPRPSTYTPPTLLMGSDYVGSRPHERGIGRLGSKVVLRMAPEGTSLGVNGGVAGVLMRLAALSD